MRLTIAVLIYNAGHGHPNAESSNPNASLLDEAAKVLTEHDLISYAAIVLATGSAVNIPTPNESDDAYAERLKYDRDFNVDLTFDAVFSGRPVSAKHHTDALVQREGGQFGVKAGEEAFIDHPVVTAESRMRLIEAATGQLVVSRVIRRGRTISRADDRSKVIHPATIRLSAWRMLGGWPVNGKPRKNPTAANDNDDGASGQSLIAKL